MECPECHASEVARAGSVAGPGGKRIQRYECKGCGKKFHPSLETDRTAADDELTDARREVAQGRRRQEVLKRELASARAEVKALETEVDKLTTVAGLRSIERVPAPPDWLVPRLRSVGSHRATVMTMLSDLHADEVVRPSEVGWANAYNRHICEQRLERFFQKVVEISSDYFAGAEYDGCVCMLGGDLLSGNIHDELVQTNAATLIQSIEHWPARIAAGIAYLADAFGKVHVPVVIGNHPRLTKKARGKLRALDNADWLIGQMVKDRLRDDSRVTFDIPDSTDAFVRVYGTSFLLTHGDQTTGGGGIGGIWPPIMRMRARKQQRYARMGQEFDWLVMGHWHQLIMSQGMIVNGSVVGYSEFSAIMNFAPERAQQALWLVTPEHGVTLTAPVFVDDPKAEGWQRKAKKVAGW